jgi:hypothetical protein
MLAVLPITAFIAIFILFFNLWSGQDWRHLFVRAVLCWAAYLVLLTELLSLFHAITQLVLTIVWFLPILVSGTWLYLRTRKGRGVKFPMWRLPRGLGEWVMVLSLLLVLGITALVAWLTPPQTWESLRYHMARVAHWTQERAVQYYTTGISVQNSMSPGGEMIILHLYVLVGGDRLACFVEWFSMFGSVVAASLVIRQLMGKRWIVENTTLARSGELLTALVVVTIPTGIVQASSTMTDYVAAFWIMCMASEALSVVAQPVEDYIPDGKIRDRYGIVASSLSAALAILTKPTVVAFIVPFAVWIAVVLLRRLGVARFIIWAVTALVIVLLLNCGQMFRSYQLYGNPLNDPKRFVKHSNQLLTAPGLISNLVRNAALHTGTPLPFVNSRIYKLVGLIHRTIRVDMSDPRTTSVGPYREIPFSVHEDMVGNLAHAILILFSLVVVTVGWKWVPKTTLIYAWICVSTFVLFSLMYKWQIFGSRYHLPFFVLFAPLIAYVLIRFIPRRMGWIVGICLVIGAIPWLFMIDSRPLIVIPGHTYVGSVLKENRTRLYFAQWTSLMKPYTAITDRIKAVNCSSVEIMLTGQDAEYPLWVLLGAPRASLYIQWNVAGPSSRYKKPGFIPCAVICHGCQGKKWSTLEGLPRVYSNTNFQLYMKQDELLNP